MLFRTDDVAEMVGLPPTTLRDWVAKGYVIPTRKGGIGRGAGHRFDGKQVMALAVAAALHQSETGCSPQHVGYLVRMFDTMDEQTCLALLSPASPWNQELVDAWVTREVPERARIKLPHPDYPAANADANRRLGKVQLILRERLMKEGERRERALSATRRRAQGLKVK